MDAAGKFKNVIVSDFSENMLKQSAKFIAEDPSIDARYLCHITFQTSIFLIVMSYR